MASIREQICACSIFHFVLTLTVCILQGFGLSFSLALRIWIMTLTVCYSIQNSHIPTFTAFISVKLEICFHSEYVWRTHTILSLEQDAFVQKGSAARTSLPSTMYDFMQSHMFKRKWGEEIHRGRRRQRSHGEPPAAFGENSEAP